jgi:hypothetical protein
VKPINAKQQLESSTHARWVAGGAPPLPALDCRLSASKPRHAL